MTDRWLVIRVELLFGAAEEFDPPPGRDFLVAAYDTFGELADAINSAFARWDVSHLHEFRLTDGRTIGLAEEDDQNVEDETNVELGDAVKVGDSFTYVFDLGDDWTHRCTVLRDDFDPEEEFGGPPDSSPVPIFGWGMIPDQYGRITPDDDD